MFNVRSWIHAAAITLVLSGIAMNARAWNTSPTGKVTRIEASDAARFQLDVAVGSCTWVYMDYANAAGLFSNDSKAKVESAKQLVLAAFLSGRRIQVFADSGTCRVEYLHLAP